LRYSVAVSVADAIRARDDWPQIQQRCATGKESLRGIASSIGVFDTQLRRAVEYDKKEKVIKAERKAKKAAKSPKETAETVSGEVTDNLPARVRPQRDLGTFSIDGTIEEMRDNQAELQDIADENRARSPYIAISALTAANNTSGLILKAMVQYQVHSEKDISKHPGFNRMVSIIMDSLKPFPDAAAAVILALDTNPE